MACENITKCPREVCPYDEFNEPTIRELIGYCPIVDMFFDEEKQATHEAAKMATKKKLNPLKYSKRRR